MPSKKKKQKPEEKMEKQNPNFRLMGIDQRIKWLNQNQPPGSKTLKAAEENQTAQSIGSTGVPNINFAEAHKQSELFGSSASGMGVREQSI
mmetsp:Transcript_16754/g.19404  ORF Transcript_16754/g.19404 Transcript_16754/m.19404 type:complete len:91 (+) Transcript_16754:40-312(+)